MVLTLPFEQWDNYKEIDFVDIDSSRYRFTFLLECMKQKIKTKLRTIS